LIMEVEKPKVNIFTDITKYMNDIDRFVSGQNIERNSDK